MSDMEVLYFPDGAGNTLTVKRYRGRIWPDYLPETIRGLEVFKSRDDDVIVVAYPKSGTHWLWEMVRMLMAGTTDVAVDEKESAYIERVCPRKIEALPSPRLLNTHAHFELMPPEVLSKKNCKLIYVSRDPRDVAVSFYHHHRRLTYLYAYEGEWKDYFPLYLSGKVDFESWFSYTRGWEQGMRDNPDLQVHVTSYEALQENAHEELEKIASFLGVSTDREIVHGIVERTSFETMKTSKIMTTPVTATNLVERENPVMYRKGKVGDLKNWFTLTQAEQFDAAFEREMEGTKAYELYSSKTKSE